MRQLHGQLIELDGKRFVSVDEIESTSIVDSTRFIVKMKRGDVFSVNCDHGKSIYATFDDFLGCCARAWHDAE